MSLRESFRRNPRDRAIAALAIPALGTLAIDPLVSIVDTAWVSRLGTEPLAALAIASAIFAVVFAVFNFVHLTITPLIAGEVARGSPERAGGITRGAIVISAVLGVVLALIVGALSSQIIRAFGASGEVLIQSAAYLEVRVLALPAMLVVMVGHGVYRGHQDTRTPLYVALGMNLVNLILDPLLIFSAGMGVVGAAWATVVAQWMAAAAFLLLMFGRERVRFGLEHAFTGFRGLGIVRILVDGWPMMLRSISLLFALTATTFAATRIGVVQVAAHQIALQTWLFMAFVLDSFAVAAMAMIGLDLGTHNRIAAREIANRLLALGFITGIVLAVLLALLLPFLPAVFGVEPAVAASLSVILWLVVALQPITALAYVWDGVAIGARAFPFMAISMVAATAVAVLFLFVFGGTLIGIWASLGVLTIARVIAFTGWHRWGPLNVEQDPYLESRGAV